MAQDDFAEYVAGRWGALYRTAHLLTGQRDDAEDLVQNALITAYGRWQRIRGMESRDGYVRKVLLNTYLSQQRTRRRRAAMSHLTAVTGPPTDPAVGLDLWRGVRALPPRQRAIVVLRYYEDLTEAATADVLGCSTGTVKSQCHRALASLRVILTDDIEVEERS